MELVSLAAEAAATSVKSAVCVEEVSFAYGEIPALTGVSFTVEPGEIFGLLGPNGSGKTTLFRILSTLLLPSAGHAFVEALDLALAPAEVRRAIGAVFQHNTLDPHLRLRENLLHQGHLYGLSGIQLRKRIDQLLRQFGLADRSEDLVKVLSGGLKRRLELAKALLHEPRVLLLDEPTAGVDPGVRHDFWLFLKETARRGITVLLTSHLLDEAEQCDRLGILTRGRLVAVGTPEELKNRIGGSVIVLESSRPEALAQAIEKELKLASATVEGTVRIEHPNGPQLLGKLMEQFSDRIDSVKVGRPSLTDVFIRETGHLPADWARPEAKAIAGQ